MQARLTRARTATPCSCSMVTTRRPTPPVAPVTRTSRAPGFTPAVRRWAVVSAEGFPKPGSFSSRDLPICKHSNVQRHQSWQNHGL